MKFNKNRMAKLAGIPQNRRVISENRRRAILREASRGSMRSSRALGPGDVGGTSSFMSDPMYGDSQDLSGTSMYLDDYYDGNEVGGDPRGFDSQSEYQANLRRKMFDDDTYATSIPADDAMAYLDDVEFMDMDAYDDEGNYVGGLDFDPEDDPAFGYDDGDLDDLDLFESEKSKEEKEDVVEIDDRELQKEYRNIKRKRINEARLKAVIEDELRDVLAEMQYGSGWMYGNNKPKASQPGRITRGFKGLGFK